MNDKQLIVCPNCNSQIPLDEALSLRIRKELEVKLNSDFESKIQKEKERLWELAQKKATEKLDLRLNDLQNQVLEKENLLTDAKKRELEFLKKERDLADKLKNVDLELERRLAQELLVREAKILLSKEEEYQQKVREKDLQMDQLRRTIEDLKRKSDQGSMQIQGDAQENNLKDILAATFPDDRVDDVPTGMRGADLLHYVQNSFGQFAGKIIWESKNTKAWSHEWIKKLREDQAAAQADVAILVSKVLPEGYKNFAVIENVWVTTFDFMLPLVNALRFHLFEMARFRRANVGKDEKMQLLYDYLTGNQFKNRITNIVLAFKTMKEDIEAEKRAFHKLWSKREKEIDRVVLNTSVMYGDLQGIVGSALGTIELFELPGGDIDGGEALIPNASE